MLIVVTGASGRLGQAVVTDFLAHGHDVMPVDVRPSNNSNHPLTRILDLSQPGPLLELCRGADAICHLGNAAGIDLRRSSEGFANNACGTFNIFHVAAELGIKKVTWASSVQVYGCFGQVPGLYSPPAYLPLDESHPQLVRSPYALSKVVGEKTAEAFVRRVPGLQVFSLRYAWITPDAQVPHVMPRLISANMFMNISQADAARAARLCLESDRPGHTPLNIAGRRPLRPWDDQAFLDAYGVVPEMRGGLRPEHPLICTARAKEVLGFEA
jgi:nucleoside-diphosphate-sugar epimerase